ISVADIHIKPDEYSSSLLSEPIERMLISETACLQFTDVITFPTCAGPNMQMNAPFSPTRATEAPSPHSQHAQQRISNEHCGSAADHSGHGGGNLQLTPDPGCRGANCPPELAEFSG
ncbi:hypothetical protein D4764_07G0007740, partial [Takifugu flavidus]